MYKQLENGEVVLSISKWFKTISILVPNIIIIKRYNFMRTLLAVSILPILITGAILESIWFVVISGAFVIFASSMLNRYLISKYPRTNEVVTRKEYLEEIARSTTWLKLIFIGPFLGYLVIFYIQQ